MPRRKPYTQSQLEAYKDGCTVGEHNGDRIPPYPHIYQQERDAWFLGYDDVVWTQVTGYPLHMAAVLNRPPQVFQSFREGRHVHVVTYTSDGC